MSDAEEALRIGVIAPTSMVARLAVIPGIVTSDKCELVAVASLSAPTASGGPEGDVRRHPSYEALLTDPDVEAVYIPLPNSMHREWTERSAAAGKHVLCEKPLSHTPEDTAAMARACEEAGVVLMEAYMTPFHPRSAALLSEEVLGRLGRIVYGDAVFNGTLSRPDDHRWRPEMGGGALLDVGIYCLSPLLAAAGSGGDEVEIWRAVANRAPLGVDASFEGVLSFPSGMTGLFRCSFEAAECQRLTLVGTEATLVVDHVFTPSWNDDTLGIVAPNGSFELLDTGGGDPYRNMVDHFAEVVRGRAALRRPPAVSLELARLLARLEGASVATSS